MKGKVLSLVICVVFIMGVIFGACAAPTAVNPAPTQAAAPSGSSSQPAAPATQEKVIKWRLQAPYSQGMALFKPIAGLADKIKVMSNGRLDIEVYPGGAIVPALQEFDAVNSGTLDATVTGAHYHTSKIGLAGDLFNLYPGGPAPQEFMVWVYQGGGMELWQEMYSRHNYNIHVVGVPLLTSAELFGWFKEPINSLADFKGMKFRTAGIWGEILSRLGASVVSMPGGEIYQSMERGVLDAFEYSTPGADMSAGFHELGAYMIGPGIHAPQSGGEFLVNSKKWAELPEDLKAIVYQAVLSNAYDSLTFLDFEDTKAIEALRASGQKFHSLPSEVQREVVRLSNELYDEKAKDDEFFAKVLKDQREFFTKYRDFKSFTQPDPLMMESY